MGARSNMRLTRAERLIRILGVLAAVLLVALVVRAGAVDYEAARNVTTIVGGLQTGTSTTKTAQFSAGGNLLVSIPAGAGAVTADQGAPAAQANRWPVGLSDGAAFISPATDRTTAAAPFSVRLTNDGAAFATVATDRATAAAPFSVRISDGTGFGTLGLPLAGEVGITRIASTASNGVTAVQLVAATAGQTVYPTTITLANASGTAYTVDLLSSTGPTILKRVFLPAQATHTLDLRGDVRTDAGDALQFKLDAAGATVYASGAAVKR